MKTNILRALDIILKNGVILFLICSCNGVTDNKDQERNRITRNAENELRIKGILTKGEAIGYGETYMMHITSVLYGYLEQDTICIVVPGGDKTGHYFESHLSSASIEILFTKHEENVEYNMMPILGFVDKNRTSWKIKQLE